ncbi:MAG: hypothetical protein GY796_07500, partial [Chloroflexi bacterium]|nr:hypothetical protein [Chloroflexota bacterium]
LLFFGVLFNYLLVSPAGAMGRFFFPALPALAILPFYGLSRWLDLARAKSPITKLAWATNILLAGLTIVTLWGYLQTAYARPSSFTIDTVVPHPTNAQFDNLVKLRGYDVNTTAVQPGDVLELELYWEVTGQPPGNYLMFLHLIDENGIMVAQRDTHPGLGNFPSGRWQPGDQFVDKVRLHIPETMYTPSTADLSLGLYVPDGYRLGITAADGSGLGDALVLETITLQSAAGEAPNPIQQNFNDKSALVGYEYNTQQLQPGDVLAVNLYWQALQKLDRNYEVEMWVCDEPCEKWMSPRAAAVHPLHPPTSAWQPGQTISDTVQLSLPGDIPAGTYFIHVALIDPMTKEPQNILADDGHILDNRLLLARVRLTP